MKRQEAAVQARTVPVPRAKRKAAQRKNPSTSTATTRRRGRPPAATTTAPRKTAYKDKRGQTPALPTVEASSDAETEEATEEETSPRPTPQLDETSNDDSEGQTEAAATSHNRKADPKPSAETEKIIVSQVNDSSSSDDDSEEATVVRNLLTPRKRQERRQASSDEGGDATARAGTVIPETDYEGPVFTSPQRSPRRAGQKTHGKQKRPDKGKGKAVDPSPSPPLAQGGPAEEEEAGESDRSADSDRREDEEVVAAVDQRQPVASTSRKPSQKKSSGAAPPRSPPKKRVAASASQKSPARRPASSSSHARKSPAKKQAQQQQDPTPETGSASSEDEGQPSRQRTSPRRRFELAPSEDEVTDDGEDETKTMYPPEIFQHRDFIEAEDGRRRRVWVADRFWVHDLWGPGGREEVVACLEENGGRVVESMKKAHIAILPHWYFDEFKELYDDATAAGAFPILYAWVKDCARRSAKEGRPVRLSPFEYAARLPHTTTDGRSKRYLRLTYEETEKFARLYARWTRKEISRGEMLERMQSQFFDGTKRTTIDGFDACLRENEQQIRSLAKRINREAVRQYTDSEDDGDATDAAAGTEDEAYEGMRRSRSQSRSQSRPRPSSAAAARQREVDEGVDEAEAEAEAAELEALPALAAKHGRTLHLVQSIYLACAFDLDSTETVFDILKEFDLGTVGLSPDGPSDSDKNQRAMQTARDQILDRVEVIWSPSLDRKLLQQRGPNFDAKVARDKNIAIEMVRERREALEVVQGTGIESWYPDEEGFEQWRREVADADDSEEEEESELEPLDGPAAAG